MTKRVEKAIDIFLDAINNGTLGKGSCQACAVGNLIAEGLGGKITKEKDTDGNFRFKCTVSNSKWAWAFATDGDEQTIDPAMFQDARIVKEVEATDFSIQELMEIEYAFETNTEIRYPLYYLHSPKTIRADQIKGLEAVVKVMLEFDEQPEDVKEVFTKRAELIPV